MFAHDTEFNLRHIAALVNTLPGDAAIGDTAPDQLMTAADLAQFLAGWRWDRFDFVRGAERADGTPDELWYLAEKGLKG